MIMRGRETPEKCYDRLYNGSKASKDRLSQKQEIENRKFKYVPEIN